jgi:hypothetical protein
MFDRACGARPRLTAPGRPSGRSRCERRGAPIVPRASRGLRHLTLHVGSRLQGASVLLLLPGPAERPVENLLHGAHRDPIVIRTDQEVEPNERSTNEFELGTGRVFELRDLESLAQLVPSTDPLGAGAATLRPILMREFMGRSAVLQQSRLTTTKRFVLRPERYRRSRFHGPNRRPALGSSVEECILQQHSAVIHRRGGDGDGPRRRPAGQGVFSDLIAVAR